MQKVLLMLVMGFVPSLARAQDTGVLARVSHLTFYIR